MTAGDRKARSLMAQASQDLQQGRTELLSALKRVPVSDLHNTDPTLFARLTPQQRAELFSKVAQQGHPTTQIGSPRHRSPDPAGPSAVRRLWNRLPLPGRCQLIGLLTASILAGGGLAALAHEHQLTAYVTSPSSLPSDVATWPDCRRLTLASDGCTYVVKKGLSWDQAAQALGQNPRELKTVNHHLAGRSSLYRGDQLIVWRDRIRLEN
ncbi:hypothetical protein [Shumkonia mesophila]|uniref:hypothetical protein n=1 Tax=Shumkonia mesophila TaxID=2838854 RepID=UPI0029352FAC|nr:hypothetical protein [Shumkonia mesophila]